MMPENITPEWIDEPWWKSEPCNCGICSDDPAVLLVQMAIANNRLPDGHQLKLTRDDVRTLCDATGFADTTEAQDNARAIDRVAAKIAALLPPE